MLCNVNPQVMGLKMLVDDSRYTLEEGGDVEGLGVADAINAHLPPQIRIFTVQKVRGETNREETCVLLAGSTVCCCGVEQVGVFTAQEVRGRGVHVASGREAGGANHVPR